MRVVAGAAHPGRTLSTFTFDLTSGRRLALADLFRSGAPYLQTLVDESRRQLKEQFRGQDLDQSIDEGTAPKDENFGGWTVSSSAMEIVFGEYQVGPYAIGMPKVTITTATLRSVTAPSGPLSGSP